MAEKPGEKSSLDPLGLWRDMLAQWERGLNSVANAAMGSDEFSRAMHQITSMSLRMQQTMGEALGKSLQAMNLPTRSDITALGERLNRIEARLDEMASAQGSTQGSTHGATQGATRGAPPAVAAPVPRTRKPPQAG